MHDPGEAVVKVTAQDLLFHFFQCGTGGAELDEYIHAVTPLLDHLDHSIDLAFDAFEAGHLQPVDRLFHDMFLASEFSTVSIIM